MKRDLNFEIKKITAISLFFLFLLLFQTTQAQQNQRIEKFKTKIEVPKSANDLKKFLSYRNNNFPIVSAHRGGPMEGFPENCIATFENTLKHGFALLEIDPRYTKDSVIILMHDQTLDRTTNGHGKVSDYTYAEIQKLFLKDITGKLTTYKIPTLDEVLVWAKGKTILVIDEKDVPLEARVNKIKQHKAQASALVIAYKPEDISLSYKLDKNIMMEIMMDKIEMADTFEKLNIPWSNVVAFVGHNPPISRNIIDLIHKKNVKCIVGSSRNIDKDFIQGKIDQQELSAGFHQLIHSGADIIEADLGILAIESLKNISKKGVSNAK